MNITVVLLALSAAVLHATWNAVLRTGEDRLWTVTVMSSTMTVVALPLVAVLPMPASDAWPFLAISACLQVGYSVFLVAAYRHGELGQVYPIVRGSVPVLVTIGGLVFADDQLSSRTAIGVALVGMGIMSLTIGKGRTSTTSILYALATGLIIATYTLIDSIGVKQTEHAASYAAWICVLYGTLLPLTFVAIRGRPTINIHTPETRKAMGGGVVSLLAYGAVIIAFSLGPAGPITAIRETSLVFAAIIGRLFLQESLTPRRISACIIVVLGAVSLR